MPRHLIKTVGYRYYCDHCSRGTCRNSVRRLYNADRSVSYVCDPCYEGALGYDRPWEELSPLTRTLSPMTAIHGTISHMAQCQRFKAGGFDAIVNQGRTYLKELTTLPPIPLP